MHGMEHIKGLADYLGSVQNASGEPLSEVSRRWESERWLMRNDPVLAILLRIEAIAGDRAECQQCAASKLVAIGDLARQAAEKHTGKPFKNPLFP